MPTQTQLSWFESFRYIECGWAAQFQHNFHSWNDVWIQSAHFGHPTIPYVVVFPFLYLLSSSSAAVCLSTVAIAEYLNTLLKWAFNDHRPYWWINEIQRAKRFDRPIRMLQVPETCETGPGFPSGHVMITTCVWFLLWRRLIRSTSSTRARLSVRFVGLLLIMYVAVIGVGRVYISAHFIDQVVFGLLFGLGSALLLERCERPESNFRQMAIVSIGCLATGLLLQRSLWLLEMDPNWTLRMAKKHCFKSIYAKADSTPMYVIWKTGGALFGSALTFGYLAKRWPIATGQSWSAAIKIKLALSIVIAVLVSWSNGYISLSPTNLINVQHFYLYTYVQYALLPIFVHALAYFLSHSIERRL